MRAYPTIALAALLIATTFPVTTADPGSYDEMKTTTGPGSVTVEKESGIGLSACFADATAQAASCNPSAGGASSLGGAVFFVGDQPQSGSDWNSDPSFDPSAQVGREVRVWVEQTVGADLGGFSAIACTDGDDDDSCDGGNPVDVVVQAFAGNGDDPCDGDDKDYKDCDSSFEAELFFCARHDNWTGDIIGADGTITTVTDTEFDDFVVFISYWTDTTLVDNDGNNNGVGASPGTFNVYAEYLNFLGESDCDAVNTQGHRPTPILFKTQLSGDTPTPPDTSTIESEVDEAWMTHAPSLHCHGGENPHRYAMPATPPQEVSQQSPQLPDLSAALTAVWDVAPDTIQAYAEPDLQLAGAVLLHDGSMDCPGEGADVDSDGEPDAPMVGRALISDGDYEFGVGGGFFPADHHGAGFLVEDDTGGHVAFTVASDANGDGYLGSGECRQVFVHEGATTCTPGADGGWWVIIHADAADADPATKGRIISGSVSEGSRHFHLPMLAAATIYYDGQTDSFDWESPAGWDCSGGHYNINHFYVYCYSDQWACQNWNVMVGAWHEQGNSAEAIGGMECDFAKIAKCNVKVTSDSPGRLCNKTLFAGSGGYFYCDLNLVNRLSLRNAMVECFNDP